MEAVALITIIFTIVRLAVKISPDVVASVKRFIDALNKTEFTEEELEKLRLTKRPEEY